VPRVAFGDFYFFLVFCKNSLGDKPGILLMGLRKPGAGTSIILNSSLESKTTARYIVKLFECKTMSVSACSEEGLHLDFMILISFS
jgi:hypothetical protein